MSKGVYMYYVSGVDHWVAENDNHRLQTNLNGRLVAGPFYFSY